MDGKYTFQQDTVPKRRMEVFQGKKKSIKSTFRHFFERARVCHRVESLQNIIMMLEFVFYRFIPVLRSIF